MRTAGRSATALLVACAFGCGAAAALIGQRISRTEPATTALAPVLKPGKSPPPLPAWIGDGKIGETADIQVLHDDGSDLGIRIQVFAPPFPVIQPLKKTFAETSLATPEDAHFAQISARDTAWLMACFDAAGQKKLRAIDAQTKGKFFSGLKDVASLSWPPKFPKAYVSRAFFTRAGKDYCVLNLYSQGDDEPIQLCFALEAGKWLRTFDLDGSALLGLFENERFIASLKSLPPGARVIPVPTTTRIEAPAQGEREK